MESTSQLREAIGKIIRKIPKELVFDSHYIIDTLIKDHSDVYFDFIRQNSGKARDVNNKIAKNIGHCGLAVKKGDSLSYTIHWKANKCALWKRK